MFILTDKDLELLSVFTAGLLLGLLIIVMAYFLSKLK